MKFKYARRTSRDVALRLLKHDVDDDLLLRAFAEVARIVRASATLCEQAGDDFAEGEVFYVEELLGLSFVVLQAKIRRVSESAQVAPLRLSNACKLGADYKGTGKTLIELVWSIGNYYKHCDEWDSKVWEGKKAGEQESRQLRLSRNTRRIVEKVGIKRSSTGNMRTAYDFFEIDWASDCAPLAERVQDWANAVYQNCAKSS